MSLEFRFIRTEASNEAFQMLVKFLDQELAITDGDEHDFYHQFNGIESLNEVVIAYANEIAIACGAIKNYNKHTVEVKRMFTLEEYRGQELAVLILDNLEAWSRELGYSYCILETGTRQLAALALYKKQGYQIIENYAQYKGLENSVCFKKKIVKD